MTNMLGPIVDLREEAIRLLSSPSERRHEKSSSTASTCTLGYVEEPTPEAPFDDPIIDLTVEESGSVANRLLRDDEFALETLRTSNIRLRPGDFVQVQDASLGNYLVDFLEVRVIVQDRTGKCVIRGIPFTRTRGLFAKLPKKLNEVCMILRIDQRDDARNESPLYFDVSPASVTGKRALKLTNASYPEHCCTILSADTASQSRNRGRRTAEQEFSLVCRWKLKIYVIAQGRRAKTVEEALERVHFSEVTEYQYRSANDILRGRWRGGRFKGGSWGLTHPDRIDLDEDSPFPSCVRGPKQKYTLFDSYSGAGGVSRGAQSAGFKVKYAVDKSPDVWDTYTENFGAAKLYKMSVDRFIQESRDTHIRVDVLHLSPPCQYFSPAHTRECIHDDENIFALFGCNELINKTRPRLVTVEQTFGITHDRHLIYLRALIGAFTQFGYSVRWKIVHLCTWGSAQDRKRLIVIAAAPGESLPPFPPATHSDSGEGGLKPFNTISQAIGGLRQGDDLHDIDSVKHYHPPRAPIDAHRLAGTITTGGSDLHYPDGTREFTLREFASLQGFPKSHRFKGTKTSIKKQIGNAFPPSTVRVLYKHLEEWLLIEDGMLPYRPPIQDVVMVVDDSEVSVRLSDTSPRNASTPMDDLMEIDEATYRNESRNSSMADSSIDLT